MWLNGDAPTTCAGVHVPEEATYDDFVRVSKEIMKGRSTEQQREIIAKVLHSLMPEQAPGVFRWATCIKLLGVLLHPDGVQAWLCTRYRAIGLQQGWLLPTPHRVQQVVRCSVWAAGGLHPLMAPLSCGMPHMLLHCKHSNAVQNRSLTQGVNRQHPCCVLLAAPLQAHVPGLTMVC